jgi:hypothetical protein
MKVFSVMFHAQLPVKLKDMEDKTCLPAWKTGFVLRDPLLEVPGEDLSENFFF